MSKEHIEYKIEGKEVKGRSYNAIKLIEELHKKQEKMPKKDKETFYYRGSKLKDGFIRSFLLAEAPKTASTKKDIILFEIQNVKGHLTTIAVTPKEAILISNALLSAYTEWDCRELNKKYKKSKIGKNK